jgi:hypothetical protein
MHRITIALLFAAIAVLAALSGPTLPDRGARPSHADFGVSDPIPYEVEFLGIDLNTTGNTPNSIASVNTCRVATPGQIFTIDIVVDEIPAETVNGIRFDLLYTPGPSGLRVTSRGLATDVGWMTAPPAGTYFDIASNSVPDNDGTYHQEATALGDTITETGEMVMAHLTVEVLGASVNTLSLNDIVGDDFTPNILDGTSTPYPIANFDGLAPVVLAEIRSDGSSCPPDTDEDGIPDATDNCPTIANISQVDWDTDASGDACDPDVDGDGVPNGSDLCAFSLLGVPVDSAGCSQLLSDADLDGVCDPGKTSTLCTGSDDCPGTTASPVDASGCSQPQVDGDMDGVCDPGKTSTLCTGTDNCPTTPNTDQTNTDAIVSPPGDGLGDACDDDDDNDTHTDAQEVATWSTNTVGSDPLDPASIPEVCDFADNDLNQGRDEGFPNNDGDTQGGHNFADCVDPDDDNDFFPDSGDNCQFVFNITQVDFDMDGQGDACDDYDSDGVMDDADNCRVAYNPNQANTDVIVAPPGDPLGDVCDSEDDNDGILDPFDNCPSVPNPLQEDIDADGNGDACDDSDSDGVMDYTDNCYAVPNPGQDEHDADGTGDACDPEDDGDGIFDGIDGTWNGSSFTSQSISFSDGFTDQHIGGVSYGSITARGGIYVQVSDLTAEGFLLWGIGAGAPGSVSVCNETQIVIGGGSIATAACTNSTVIRVIAGSVSARAGNLVASLPVGANVVVEEYGQGYSIENTSGSTANISVNGSPLPPGTFDEDNDNDGYLTTRENFLGTLPGSGCAATVAPLDENPDPGPRDNNDDRWIDLSDISRYSPHYNSPSPLNQNYNNRFDLNADAIVDLSDISLMGIGYNTQCTP